MVPISVNLSRNDVFKGNICDKLLEIMGQHRVSPHSVHLEITESAYIENTPFCRRRWRSCTRRVFGWKWTISAPAIPPSTY